MILFVAPLYAAVQSNKPNGFNYWHAILLGMIEGLTEFLPISSTGHLILASRAFGLEKGAIDAFNIVIQGAALFAILGLYWERAKSMMWGLVGKNEQGKSLFLYLLISFLPAAIIGVLFDEMIEERLFHSIPIALALIVGGLLMIGFEMINKRRKVVGVPIESMTWKMALVIGIAQIFSMWPGTSRSMATILGALIAGMSLPAAAEYSFLLALPTLGAASLYKLITAGREIFQLAHWSVILLGMIVSAFTAAVAVKGFVAFLSRGGLTPFGYYRIILGIVVLWWIGH
ncbi:MAG: undecaprenyl-diphosphate phosphatase [bacterium]|nr:undecaprenyl-diphosphate phosphatase [bacterium]